MTEKNNLLEIAVKAAVAAGEKTLTFFNRELDVLNKEDNSPLTLADLEANQIINEILQKTNIPILSEENKLVPFTDRKGWKEYWLVDPLDGTKEFINSSPEYTVNIALIKNNYPIAGIVYAPVLKELYYASVELGSFKVTEPGMLDFKLIHKKAQRLPFKANHNNKLIIVASRSHIIAETQVFIEKLKKYTNNLELLSIGSSLKLCMIAEGKADIYPRLGPTMEWDIAASHAIAEFAGCRIFQFSDQKKLMYNKKELRNPGFIVYREQFDEIVKKAISKN